nr:TPM domain-containing protein [uncultured Solibaculum sp.]
MKKRILLLLVTLTLCFVWTVPAFAEDIPEDTSASAVSEQTSEESSSTIPQQRLLPRLTDQADLLTDSEEDALLMELNEISERQQCDVAVATVNSLEGKTATAYADDFYDYNGYGMGDGDDGILLLISMENREWAITTYGFAITAFTDEGQQYIVKKFKSDLGAGRYSEAFEEFASLCDKFLTQAKTGEPYDSSNLPNDTVILILTPIVLLIGFLFASLIMVPMKRKLKNVQSQPSASSYIKENSIQITDSSEQFLYNTITKTPRSNDNNGGGYSGSSTHVSSSGRSHGGSSGSF